MYTQEQYLLLETFENGRLVQELPEGELFAYQFLMEEGLLQPRADIKDGWHLLSERGKMLLESRRLSEQQKKAVLEEQVKKRAEAKKEKVSQFWRDILMLILGGVITVIVENIGSILDWLCSLFK